jgi:hypothetical protein
MGYAGREAAPPSEPGHWSPPTSTATSLAVLAPVDPAPQPSQSSAPAAPAVVVLAQAPTLAPTPLAPPAAPIVVKQSYFGSSRHDLVGRPALAAGG